jgi:hypothetical protein
VGVLVVLVEAERAFLDVPAVVLPLGDDVDLFHHALTRVGANSWPVLRSKLIEDGLRKP